MKLHQIRLSNFMSFGEEPTEFSLEDITYLIGPNGSGKTAVLQAMCRLFSFNPQLRGILPSDFYVPMNEVQDPEERQLWIEVDFIFPELTTDENNSTVAPHFGHMRLDEVDGIPRVRYRLSATLGIDGDIEESLDYVLDINPDGSPLNITKVPRVERNLIHVHYLPARRDPADHIAYSTNALLGRMLRSVNWENERSAIKGLTDQISDNLAKNTSINAFSDILKGTWSGLHKGSFFSDPKITFIASEIEALLRHMSVSFEPGHNESLVDFTRLSDGQKSMLYLAVVLSSQAIGRAALSGEDESFDLDRLKPPSFTLIALEEPENSLSPHYLGRIVSSLNTMASSEDAQALIATHAPSILRRVEPESIRYLRLTGERKTRVTEIQLPAKTDDAHKFVRGAVLAFPEIYFSRLVVLVEGDSEQIVIPRLLQAKGAVVDDLAVTIAPLGGRHVNHFWRLLSALEIPYVTLLDLDVARYQAGWGRIKYINDQLSIHHPDKTLSSSYAIPAWNSGEFKVRGYRNYLDSLEQLGVYYSYPLDLDFALLLAYPDAYQVNEEVPDESTINAVLGKSHYDSSQYSEDELKLFNTYHRNFKLGSKPAAHIDGLAQLSDEELLEKMPISLGKLADAVLAKLREIPE